jgi:hypothetical protein
MDRHRIGRIQRNCRRALLVAGRPLTTREMAEWVYANDKLPRWQVDQTKASARRFCEPIRKLRRPGEPWLWQLK